MRSSRLGLPGWDWSDETRTGWAEEESAYELGDFEAAAEASLRMWVDGPRRSPKAVDPTMRTAVREMVLRSYVLDQDVLDSGAREEAFLDPPVNERLAEINCPILVLVGEEDVDDMRAIAAHIAESVDGARLASIPNSAHLPSLEKPVEVNSLLLEFLGTG